MAWTPRTPFYYGWVVLFVGALGTYVATGAAQITLGGIQSLITEDTGWDRRTLAFAVTAGTWVGGSITPFVGRLADKYGPRGLMPVAALVTGICFFALAGSQSVWQFYAAYIIARAIANPNLVGVVPRTVSVNFFQRRRGLVLGLTSTFRPISGAVNIQAISIIASFFSWRAAYRYLGAFSLVLVIPLFLLMRRRPEDIGLRPDGDPAPPDSGSTSSSPRDSAITPATQSPEPVWTAGEAARTSAFWLIVFSEMFTILTSGTISFQVVPYLVDSGLTQPLAVAALSLSSLFGALVNPAWGMASDRYSPRKLAMAAILGTNVIAVFFLVFNGGTAGFVVAILWGTASGGLNVLGSMMLAQYFGRASFGAITGLMGPFQIGALGAGPAFGAILFNQTGGYTVIWIYSVAAYAIALALIFAVRPPKRRGAVVAGGIVRE
jgi:sugar phosphate permease